MAQTSRTMSFFSCFLPFFSLVFLLQALQISSSSPTPITIPLSFSNTDSYADLYQKLSHLALASLARAHHIKNPQLSSTAFTSTTPLLPHSYGAYSISLSFGTPPQTISLVMDTGSDFLWFPCTKRYQCKNCSFPGAREITSFSPKQSSSIKIVGCLNKKCSWIHPNFDPQTSCGECQSLSAKNCTQICPPYLILYGSGSTGGIAIVETLDLPNKKVPNFLVGCSLFSSRQPAGIAGFGRGPASLPSQLGLKKFSYCLLSRRFDDTGESGFLVLDGDSNSGKKTENFSYTPLAKNPIVAGKSALQVYYYVGLRRISVGMKKVKIPYKYLAPDSDGSGGTIVDSGSTLTFMSSPVFEVVAGEFIKQVKLYRRAENIESLTGLRPCFNLSGHDSIVLPELKFSFKGGAEMKLPLANYFSFVGGNEVLCLTMVTDNIGPALTTGPSIILGSFQMQNYNVEYDLLNERFGFRQQSCK
ncbi:probable aspartyl protease At4g16563 [Coffea eugenioides]|uniref:Probable aspartyl protease At4g16563 n=1 Tax=Coffea arabica TaxID=13443 RepID=A0A6P6TXG9_COFAR|nr:probable aspartyl protease At4g16563 [Coffea arabica]XP_027159732.1 probable aspartyl protease At4g16563 [Coffea eugenioides]